MSITWGTGSISCTEKAGTMKEQGDDLLGLMSASVTLICAYSDRHALVADLVGSRFAWPKGAPGLVPRCYNWSTEFPIVPPESGSGTDGEAIVYREAEITFEFSTKIIDQYTESIEPASEFLKLDHHWFVWPDGTELREEEAPGIQQNSINFVRTLLAVSPPLSTALKDLIGYTNSDTCSFSTLGLTALPDTLLFLPPQITTKIDSTNIQKFDITKRFNYNPAGFNTYWRSDAGARQQILVRGTLTPYNSYPSTTFTGVLL